MACATDVAITGVVAAAAGNPTSLRCDGEDCSSEGETSVFISIVRAHFFFYVFPKWLWYYPDTRTVSIVCAGPNRDDNKSVNGDRIQSRDLKRKVTVPTSGSAHARTHRSHLLLRVYKKYVKRGASRCRGISITRKNVVQTTHFILGPIQNVSARRRSGNFRPKAASQVGPPPCVPCAPSRTYADVAHRQPRRKCARDVVRHQRLRLRERQRLVGNP